MEFYMVAMSALDELNNFETWKNILLKLTL